MHVFLTVSILDISYRWDPIMWNFLSSFSYVYRFCSCCPMFFYLIVLFFFSSLFFLLPNSFIYRNCFCFSVDELISPTLGTAVYHCGD